MVESAISRLGALPGGTKADLAESRGELLEPFLLVPSGAALFFLFVQFDGDRLESWLPVLAFSGVAFAAFLLRNTHRTCSAILLAAGAFGALTVALTVYPRLPFLSLYALVVAMASVLLGPGFGLGGGIMATVVIVALPAVRSDTSSTMIGMAIFLMWAVTGLTWLATRPAYTALNWAWYRYLDGLRLTEQLRDRQSELVSLMKSLEETCIRLEQLNVELARARALADEARQIKDEFAASVSHELRTPLNMIIGFSEMMVLSSDTAYDEPLPAVYRPDVEAIYRNATHISNLIDDILDLSQIDAHRMALQREDTSLVTIVDDAIASVAGLFHERRLRLIADLPPDIPPVHVDATRIRQVLLNLLTNAARFTDHGGVTVAASVCGHEVLMTVTDTGVGITSDEMQVAFEPFRQVGQQQRVNIGNGLGLAISRRFIEMHGGNMWAEARPTEGTAFKFTLPVGEMHVVASAPPRWETWMTSQVAHQVKTVFAIDSDGEAVRILQRYLDGYRVLATSSVEEIRTLSQKETVHAIVLTASNGLDAQKKQLGHSGLAYVPTIACPFRNTSLVDPTLGVVDYLIKPVTVARLRRALRRIDASVRSVLVVDDDPEMARLLERMFRSTRRNCQIWEAQDGHTGLELLRRHHPSVLLLDLLMPGMDGYAMLDAIRKDPEVQPTPVIVISARGKDRESVVVDSFGIHRDGGLTVGETMQLLRASLDVLITPASLDNDQGQIATNPRTLVSPKTR